MDGNWGLWSEWSSLKGIKNPEVVKRKRVCNNPAPSNGGEWCEGVDEESLEVYKGLMAWWCGGGAVVVWWRCGGL